jgi:hypothetical protein
MQEKGKILIERYIGRRKKILIRCKKDRRENTKVKKMLKREQLGV